MPRIAASKTLKAYLAQVSCLDLRALAVFRIGLGSLVLWDLGSRATSLEDYTDLGLIPRSRWLEFSGGQHWPCVHLLFGSWGGQALLCAVAAAFAVMLVVGYRTRVATIATWFLVFSLQKRNPVLSYAADDYLRLLLFWSMFLPLGARLSVDRLRPRVARAEQEAPSIASISTLALIVQIASVYVFAGLFKWLTPTWRQGSGLAAALSHLDLTTPFGIGLLRFPALLHFSNGLVLGLQILLPALLFVPWSRPGVAKRVRTAVALCFMGFHLSLVLCFRLGYFPFLGMVAWLPLLSGDIRGSGRSSGRAKSAVLAGALVSLLLLLTVTENLRSVMPDRFPEIPGPARKAANFLGLSQRWQLFATPMTEAGWTMIPAVLEDRSTVDLLDGRPLRWEQPEDPSGRFKSYRSYVRLQFLRFLGAEGDSPRMRFLKKAATDSAASLCGEWNERHPDARRVVAFQVVLMSVAPTVLLKQECREAVPADTWRLLAPP